MENAFKQIEPEATCPAEIKTAVLSEIDLLRNTLQLVELYTDHLFGAITGLLTPAEPTLPPRP